MRIFLTGMPGCGKTYWMRRLAAWLQYPGIDMDQYVQEQEGRSIPELFAQGEPHFRVAEQKALLGIISLYQHNAVVATGGGAPCYQNNLQRMKEAGLVLYLRGSLTYLARNIQQQEAERPLLAGGASGGELLARLETLYTARKEIYKQAHVTIDVATATLSTFAQAIAPYSEDQNSIY